MIFFVADIHLSTQMDAPQNIAFLDFLRNQATQADDLYILGDLFDVWLGDDIGLTLFHPVITALSEFCQQGKALYIQHGNRDFLLGSQFAKQSGATLLPDPYLLALAHQSLLLTHGDLLCTDDVEYLKMRSLFRNPTWQQNLLAQSPAERMAFAQSIQSEATSAKNQKTHEIMDATDLGIKKLLSDYHPTVQLIHGHTHKPNCHQINNQQARWVISDWRPTPINLLAWQQGKGLFHVPFIAKTAT